MWTSEDRSRCVRRGERYATDLSDAEWERLGPLIPSARRGGRPRTTNMREALNALLYLLRTGCQWSMLPKEFPPRSTVYNIFRQWQRDGDWDRIHQALLQQLREQLERDASPSAGIIDSQSVKSAEKGGARSTRWVMTPARKSRGANVTSSLIRKVSC
jgi:transposase